MPSPALEAAAEKHCVQEASEFEGTLSPCLVREESASILTYQSGELGNVVRSARLQAATRENVNAESYQSSARPGMSKAKPVPRKERSMRHSKIVLALILGILLGAVGAFGKSGNCYDGTYYRFYNNESFTDCVSIAWKNGGVRNFCLRAGEREDVRARPGDTACWSGGNYRPKNDNCFSLTRQKCTSSHAEASMSTCHADAFQ